MSTPVYQMDSTYFLVGYTKHFASAEEMRRAEECGQDEPADQLHQKGDDRLTLRP